MTSSVIMSIGEMPVQKANCTRICQCRCMVWKYMDILIAYGGARVLGW